MPAGKFGAADRRRYRRARRVAAHSGRPGGAAARADDDPPHVRVRLTARARELLTSSGIAACALGQEVDAGAEVVLATCGELEAALRHGSPAVLVLAEPSELPPEALMTGPTLHQVAFAPHSARELRLRCQWLAHARRARAAAEPTEEERTAARLINAGRVAAFQAHEAKNALSYAWANARYVKMHLSAAGARGDLMDSAVDAEEGIARALAASRTVLELSRGEALALGAVDLNAVAQKTVKLLSARALGAVSFELQLAHIPRAVADASGVAQVLTNLLLNATDAAGPGGRVRVSSEEVGGQVALTVADSGKGLSAERVDQLFKPKTTKTAGHGLGLSISRWLVASMGGAIEVDPEGPLGGAQFRVLLQVPQAPLQPAVT